VRASLQLYISARQGVEAARRGVRVNVVLDKSQESEHYTSATYLLDSGLVPLIEPFRTTR
jgi:hypothetical protein